MKISIIGLGFVGDAMYKSFNEKIKELNLQHAYSVNGYDKYKNGGIGSIDDCIDSDIIFTALPTIFNETLKSYDNKPTHDVMSELAEMGYKNTVVIKSTVEPTFTEQLSKKFPQINFVHNPEFLTARTAYEDFHNQSHIVLGSSTSCSEESVQKIEKFYRELYPNAMISQSCSTESECMKIFCNTFYAVKVQYFNELYLLAEKIDCRFDVVTSLMLKNGWINPMHTDVPGPDGKLSYGGLCFPKDTNALLEFMKRYNSPCDVLDACINERNMMRSDNQNVCGKKYETN